MNRCGVYVITSPSGKGYVGSSTRLAKRRARHFYDLKHGVHHCVALQAAWNKYGDQLNFVVIEYCAVDKVIEREQFWLDNSLFVALYNSRLDAINARPMSPEHRAALSASMVGRTHSAETKRIMRKPKSIEHAAAISAGKRGKSPTKMDADTLAKHRASVSAAIKRDWATRRVADHVAKVDWICSG